MSHAGDHESGVVVRPARREETARIAELILLGAATGTATPEEIRARSVDPVYLAAFDSVAASPDNALFVAELDGAVVGTFQVTLIPGIAQAGRLRAKLESVHVAPELRGRGIGRVMIAHAIDFARSKGAGLVELSSNKSRTDAHRFYRTLGFSQSHEGFKLEL